jgi:cell division protein FtsB
VAARHWHHGPDSFVQHSGAASGAAVFADEAAKLTGVSNAHRTSTIPRPRLHAKVERPRLQKTTVPIETHATHRVTDITSATSSIDIIPQRSGRLLLAVFTSLIVLAIGAALFVLPISSWLHQRQQLAKGTGQVATLNQANDQLQTEVDRLQTDEGIKQAAREVIDFVEKGEQRITVMPAGAAPTVLPTGWPYDLVTQIIAIRQAESDAAAAVVTP